MFLELLRPLSHQIWKIWWLHLASIDCKVKDYLILKGDWESVISWITLTRRHPIPPLFWVDSCCQRLLSKVTILPSTCENWTSHLAFYLMFWQVSHFLLQRWQWRLWQQLQRQQVTYWKDLMLLLHEWQWLLSCKISWWGCLPGSVQHQYDVMVLGTSSILQIFLSLF